MDLRRFAAAAAALILTAGASACEIKFPSAATATPEAAIAADTTAPDETIDAETSADISDDAQETEQTDDAAAEGGGNPGSGAYIEITVSEDKYIYENREMSGDELFALFDGLDSGTVVKISDENAAKKAYETVTAALEERGILYENT